MMLDVVVRNARVRTLDPRGPIATSVGLLHGRVVGLDDDIDALPASVVVDAQGATVIPGLHDAHVHTTSFGLGLGLLDLSAVVGMQSLLDAVAGHAAHLAPGAWVVGTGYGLGLAAQEHPTRAALDSAARGRPVWLTHFSGHGCVLNSAGLALVGITSAGAADGRGRIGVDATGQPDGRLEESAMDLVKEHFGPATIEQLADAIGVATTVYASEGVTTFVDAGIGSAGIDHSPVEMAAYQLARDTGRLHVRGQLMVHDALLHPVRAHALDGIARGLDLGVRTGFGDGRLGLGAMKIWVDGSSTQGGLDDDPAVLRQSIIDGARAGWQVAAHAMGEEALDLTLDALDAAAAAGPTPGWGGRVARHRIEHGGLIRPDQVRRLAAMGMVVAHQSVFLPTFGDMLLSMVDAARSVDGFRMRSLLDAGVVVAGSSDRPVAPGAPLLGIQAMVERVTESGADFGPDERVDAATALAAYTRGGAYAAGREHRSGALTTGYDADLVLLADDPTAVEDHRIGGIAVLATVVGGVAVHDPAGLFGGNGGPVVR